MRQGGSPNQDGGEARVIEWLLEEDQPSARYHALVDLLGRSPGDPEVREARSRIPRVGYARDQLRLQKPKGYWEAREPRTVREWVSFLRFPAFLSSIWRGIVLSDLGLAATDPRIRRFADLVFEYKLHLSSELNYFTEEVCIVGNTARMLTRFGYGDDRRVRKLYDWMIEDQREDGGWNCAAGKPGTLDCWEALGAFAAIPKANRTAGMERAISRGAEFYLERRLFREGKRYAPWFRFHYPNHYFYDILVGLDVLTELGYADDRRLEPALAILREKRRRDGRWVLDRVHPDVGTGPGFEYYRRKLRPLVVEEPGQPSKWITLTALRVLKRVDDAS